MYHFIAYFLIWEKILQLFVFAIIFIITIFNYIYQFFQKYLNNQDIDTDTDIDINISNKNDKDFLHFLSDIYRDDVIFHSVEALQYTRPDDILLIFDIKNNNDDIYSVLLIEIKDKYQCLFPTYLFTLQDAYENISQIEICRSMIPNNYIIYNRSYQLTKDEKYFSDLSSHQLKIKNYFISKHQKNIRKKIEEIKMKRINI